MDETLYTQDFSYWKNEKWMHTIQRKVPNFDYDADINDIFNDVDSEPYHDTYVVLDE